MSPEKYGQSSVEPKIVLNKFSPLLWASSLNIRQSLTKAGPPFLPLVRIPAMVCLDILSNICAAKHLATTSPICSLLLFLESPTGTSLGKKKFSTPQPKKFATLRGRFMYIFLSPLKIWSVSHPAAIPPTVQAIPLVICTACAFDSRGGI